MSDRVPFLSVESNSNMFSSLARARPELASIGSYYPQSTTTAPGVFTDLRQQIYYLQQDLRRQRAAGAGQEAVIVRMTEKIAELEARLNKSEASCKDLMQTLKQYVPDVTPHVDQEEGVAASDAETALPSPPVIAIENPLKEFEQGYVMNKGKTLPGTSTSLPGPHKLGAPWVQAMVDTATVVPGANDEVWNWLGRTVVIDRSGAPSRGPPASQARRLQALREKRAQQQNFVPARSVKSATMLGTIPPTQPHTAGTNWQEDLLLAHQGRRDPRPFISRTSAVDFALGPDTDKTESLASGGEEEGATETDIIRSIYGDMWGDISGGDQGMADASAFVEGRWTHAQCGGINSLANPQALLWFEESGVHRVEIEMTRDRKNKDCGFIFFVYKCNEGKRLYLGDPNDALEERQAGKKFKSKASRKTSTKLVLSLKGGTSHGQQRKYLILPCLEKAGVTDKFCLKVSNTNGGARPQLEMLPALTHSVSIDGAWEKGGSAAPMNLYADRSDPSVVAPNIRSPQIVCTAEAHTQVLVSVTCDSRRVTKGAALFVFIYAGNPRTADGNVDRRKLTFPTKDRVAEQEGYQDSPTVCVAAKLKKGTRYYIIACALSEEQNGASETAVPRTGAFQCKICSSKKVAARLLPDFSAQTADDPDQIDCEDLLHALRRSDNVEPGEHGPGKYLLWDARTLSEDPLEAIDQACAAKGDGCKFIDSDFPPHKSSINKDARDTQLPSYQWVRLSDICDHPVLFKDGVDPDDVIQGELGNCWFCAAMAAISWMRPDMLENAFSKKLKFRFTRGAFSVRIYDFRAGEDRWVVVDDYVPVDREFQPYFARSRDHNECWPLLLEKVFAKLHGCYQLMAGHCKQCLKIGPVLQCLTKANVQKIMTAEEDPEALWKRIQETQGHRGILECSTRKDKKTFELGLVCFHAYTIIGVEDVRGQRLLRIRNTWGHSEWKGPWSDGDEDKWTAAMKDAVSSYVDADDGAFYIAFADFLQHYDKLYLGNLPNDVDPGTLSSNPALENIAHRDMVRGFWNCPYAGGFSANNPQYLVRFKGGKKTKKSLCIELMIPESLHSRDHGQHELCILVCMVPEKASRTHGGRLVDLDDMVIQQSKPTSANKNTLSVVLPKGLDGCMLIPCWANKQQDGNDSTDEGSFKLAASSDVDFRMKYLPGEQAEKGHGRRLAQDDTILPHGLIGMVKDGAKKVAEAACPVQ